MIIVMMIIMYNISFVLSLMLNIILNLCVSENVVPTGLDAKVIRFPHTILRDSLFGAIKSKEQNMSVTVWKTRTIRSVHVFTIITEINLNNKTS